MRRLTYTKGALADLIEITEFMAEETGSLEPGRRLVGRIRAKCLKLASLPGTMGRPRPEIRRDLRSFVTGHYVVFIRYHEHDRLEIVAIIEGHRDIDAYFQSVQ